MISRWQRFIWWFSVTPQDLGLTDGEMVNWEAIARELLLMLSEYDTGANPLPRLIEKYTEAKENE